MVAQLVPADIIISDATILINFLNTATFSLLLKAYAGRLRITDAVFGEIKVNRRELENAIKGGSVIVHRVPIEKAKHLMKTFENFDLGEASCLVLAKDKSWRVATDDGAGKQFVRRDLGNAYLVTTFDILVEIASLGFLEKAKIVELVTKMEKSASFLYSEQDFKEFENRLALV